MRIVKFKWPSKSSSSRLEEFGLSRKVDTTRNILLIFSCAVRPRNNLYANECPEFNGSGWTHGFILCDWNPREGALEEGVEQKKKKKKEFRVKTQGVHGGVYGGRSQREAKSRRGQVLD